MKIGIDVSQIIYGTGVSIYTKNIVENLLKIDEGNEYVLFGGSFRRGRELARKLQDYDTGKKVYPFPPTALDVLWNRLHVVPIETFVGKVDVYHSSDWVQAPSKAYKVTTIHDLVPFKFPKQTHPRILSAHKARMRWVKKEVDMVIAVSQSTKEDLIDLGIDEKKIKVVYEAAGRDYTPKSDEEVSTVLKEFDIRDNYLISVGFGPRKNTKKLIDAYQKTKTKNLKLVLVGRTPDRIDERGVIVLNHVEESGKLAALYTGAEALVYPTLYEGFGIPVVEAMATGCPVVTSNVSSLPEVAGDAAVLVDPTDTNSIAEGISEAMRQKKTLSAKGIKQAAKFGWEKAAKETLAVYKKSQ